MQALKNFPVPLLGFAAYSGTGKTTLLEQLIPRLTEQGINLAVIKHSHHNIEMDKPGKDSYRLRKAGACQLVLAGTERTVVFHEHEKIEDKALIEQLLLLNIDSLDLVLIEGYRDEHFDKIELHRKPLNKPFLFKSDPSIIALACDDHIADCDLPQLDINNTKQLANFVFSYLKRAIKTR